MKRTPLSRGKGFQPRPPAHTKARRRAPRGSGAIAHQVKPLTPGTYSTTVQCSPQPKGEKAKPGKRAPTLAEKRWMVAIVEFGCIACWLDRQPSRPTAAHHILRGGRRMGHLHTLGLCDPGHHQHGAQFGMVSRHPDKAAFEARYGTEAELLAMLQEQIGAAA